MKSKKANKINDIKYLGRTHNPKVITLNHCQVPTTKIKSPSCQN